jgi:hypothetical protein
MPPKRKAASSTDDQSKSMKKDDNTSATTNGDALVQGDCSDSQSNSRSHDIQENGNQASDKPPFESDKPLTEEELEAVKRREEERAKFQEEIDLLEKEKAEIADDTHPEVGLFNLELSSSLSYSFYLSLSLPLSPLSAALSGSRRLWHFPRHFFSPKADWQLVSFIVFAVYYLYLYVGLYIHIPF